MSITVGDCLKLTALQDATVIAGHKGLDRFVSAVSVLEYAYISALAGELFRGNELILSAFTSIQDDVNAQCLALRRLEEVGETGLILYYVGIFLKRIDERLIQTANELDFPLILMPCNQYNLRYSEVITEVLEAIFEDQKKETHFVSTMIDRIAQMGVRQRSLDNVLRMLSDRLRCSLLLVTRIGEDRGFAGWPMSVQWDYGKLIALFNENNMGVDDEFAEIQWNGRTIHIMHMHFNTEKQKGLQLFSVDETAALTKQNFRQAIEVLQIFSNIWNYRFGKEGSEALVRAILNDQPVVMRRVAETLHIDILSIRIMWVLKRRSEEYKKNEGLEEALLLLRDFLKENRKLALLDLFDNSVVSFMEEPKHTELESSFAENFMQQMNSEERQYILIVCSHLESTKDVRYAYILMEQCYKTVCMIYPKRSVLSTNELQFAQECLSVMEQGEEYTRQKLEVLLLLAGQEDEKELINTLTVYLLDTDCNMQKTGEYLFLHKNTIKYRINKIKQRLGSDISKMPGVYSLYLAVALKRLLGE